MKRLGASTPNTSFLPSVECISTHIHIHIHIHVCMRVLVFSMLLLLLFIIIIIVFFQMVLQGLVPVTFSHGIVVNIHVFPTVVTLTTGNAGADFSPRMANGYSLQCFTHSWLLRRLLHVVRCLVS
ncbi:hypothetical protein, unlikely [Trypanosoma congolense IL3000]|uniref:Uncharacterized protein n=1 Tax=Trypanosoma congolense (strain IL3000) TaxID=1068625 RepID=F9WBA5_TRYCI|nr:hypothetical protein, unlikely [Trypanosoma congolense IL3000]